MVTCVRRLALRLDQSLKSLGADDDDDDGGVCVSQRLRQIDKKRIYDYAAEPSKGGRNLKEAFQCRTAKHFKWPSN